MKPPRPPEEILRRVKRSARLNGWSVGLFAGLCTLVSLAFLDLVGASVGLAVAVGGALEVHGYRLLRRSDAGGMRWLARSQLVVLAAIWAYGLPRLLSFDAVYFKSEVIPDARAVLASHGIDLDALLAPAGADSTNIVQWVHLAIVVFYGTVLLVTLLYQGGLYLYYRWRTAAVEDALRPPPVIFATPPANRPTDDYAI